MVQIRAIRPPKAKDLTLFLRTLFLRTERQIIDEITRKRAAGYVDYAEVAALERVQRILQTMVDESWSYVPQMIEKIFYYSDKHAAGYANARVLTASQTAVVQQLSNNLLGEILEASEAAYQTAQEFFTIARLEADPYRKVALTQTVAQEALGTGWKQTSAKMAAELRNQGLTGFVDKAGRKWTLSNYCNMATRTTARQAEVAALLTADDYDLWQIAKIGSTCPVCAPLEGRVYSKSGTNPDYPPLSLAFGKVDPDGGDDLTNTYLNIHPNCLHSLLRYTTVGKTEKQIQRDKDFSDPKKNPLSRDPRTKKQIAAYREKERNRQRLLREKRKKNERSFQNLSEKGITNKREPKDSRYEVNLDIVNSNEHLKKFRGITGKSIVDENICKYARAGLIHRNGTAREDLYILSSETGKILGKNISGTENFGVKPNQSIIRAVKENQGILIGLHTHPDGTPPTGSDFEVAFKRGYSTAVVAGANGSVYTYGCRERYVSGHLIDDTIRKYQKMLDSSGKKKYSDDVEAHLAALEQLGKDYGIWYETR